MRQPRIELGAQRWQRWILPLNHWRKVQGMGIEPTTSAVLKPRHKQLDHPCDAAYRGISTPKCKYHVIIMFHDPYSIILSGLKLTWRLSI